MNYASQGIGTVGHLLGELFRSKTGIALNHVPYKGSAPALTDIIGGQVDLLFDPVVTASPHVLAGKLKAVGIAAPKRSCVLPDVRTLSESGTPGVEATVWFGMVARAGTPAAIVGKLNDEVIKALKSPEVVKRFTDRGFDITPMTPQEFGAFMKDEAARWAPIVKSSGATVD